MLSGRRVAACVLALAALGGCAMMRPVPRTPADPAIAVTAALREQVAVLASDDFEGRKPGTDGERKTLRYLAETWQGIGLELGTNDPAHPWYAPVEIAVRQPAGSHATFVRKGRAIPFTADGVRLFSSGRRALLEDAPLVYVGRLGRTLDATELTGRIAVMDWDTPGHAEQRAALLENGAAAVLAIIDDPAEFARVAEVRARGSYRLAGDPDAATLDGIMTRTGAEALVGADRLAQLRHDSTQTGFRPVHLGIDATLDVTSSAATVSTHNLIGKLPGLHPEAGAVVVLAHWDHFGVCAPEAADRICNGAVDNASGLAVLTELARRLAAGPRLDRDVYFLATTGEEWGLLGARAFALDPPLPRDRIVAAFNIDSIGVGGRGKAVAMVGEGLTAIDGEVARVIAANGRELAERDYARRYVQRQDGWALIQSDIPAVMVAGAFARPAEMDRFTAERYHQPSDEVEGIDLLGAADDLQLHLALVRHFATLATYPDPPR